jgi:hypothetical protein
MTPIDFLAAYVAAQTRFLQRVQGERRTYPANTEPGHPANVESERERHERSDKTQP